MSRCPANETEDAMKRAIVVTAVLLASALSAHAAPLKKHPRVAHGRACHEVVLNRNEAVNWAFGIASGQVPLPSMAQMRRCYTEESAEQYERDNPHSELQ
jgi:hypothetical protein